MCDILGGAFILLFCQPLLAYSFPVNETYFWTGFKPATSVCYLSAWRILESRAYVLSRHNYFWSSQQRPLVELRFVL